MKRRCIIGIVVGLILVVIGFVCLYYWRKGIGFLVYPTFVFILAGVFIGRRSSRRLTHIWIFNKKKEKELEKLEAIYSGGGILQEEYFAKKIALLNAEYGDS